MFVQKKFNSAIQRPQVNTLPKEESVEELHLEDEIHVELVDVEKEIPPEPKISSSTKSKKSKKKANQKKEEEIVIDPTDVVVVDVKEDDIPPIVEDDVKKEMDEKANELRTLLKESFLTLIKNIVEAIRIGQYGVLLTSTAKEEDNPLMVNATFCLNRTMYFIHPDSDDIHYHSKVAIAITSIFGHASVEFNTDELEKYAELGKQGEDYYATTTFYNNLSSLLINNILEGYTAMTCGIGDECVEDDIYDYL